MWGRVKFLLLVLNSMMAWIYCEELRSSRSMSVLNSCPHRLSRLLLRSQFELNWGDVYYCAPNLNCIGALSFYDLKSIGGASFFWSKILWCIWNRMKSQHEKVSVKLKRLNEMKTTEKTVNLCSCCVFERERKNKAWKLLLSERNFLIKCEAFFL